MKKKVIRCVEYKTLDFIKKGTLPSIVGSSYVYYGFANCKDRDNEHVKALTEIINNEMPLDGWGAPQTRPMTVCTIKPSQSKKHAYMTMVKVLVPNSEIDHNFFRRYIAL